MKYTLIALGVLLALGIAWYGLSPLFITIKVDDALPATAVLMAQTAPVIGTVGHPAEGSAVIIEADGRQYLRYENFKTLNGPDLYVYLAKTPNAKEYVDLGLLRATEGNVNYEIPDGVDPKEYPYALVWCKQFGVLFNSAKLY
ncbi:MAG: DM13 domain-containing protein [Candidatus Pacebacteria bacterium]|nr:DM13 domain-containing protein [Candidatus Paceibacterota bacterium]